MHGFGGCGFGGFGWLGGIFAFFLFIGLIVALVAFTIWMVRRSSQNQHGTVVSSGQPSSIREILQVRYARGEITREEYLRALEDIGS